MPRALFRQTRTHTQHTRYPPLIYWQTCFSAFQHTPHRWQQNKSWNCSKKRGTYQNPSIIRGPADKCCILFRRYLEVLYIIYINIYIKMCGNLGFCYVWCMVRGGQFEAGSLCSTWYLSVPAVTQKGWGAPPSDRIARCTQCWWK